MTCRETETLDLAAFLARGTAPEFAAFRAHYPRCAECAAEVRAWTELHAALAVSTHPLPETLLRYEDGRLAEADRGAVAEHLAACAPCRDELRALAAFDRDAARAARPVPVEPRRWLRLPEWGRLAMHPALAYGLVLALLFYPALRRREPAPSGGRGDAVPAQKTANETELSDRAAAPVREERAAPAEEPVGEVPEGMYRRERAPAAPASPPVRPEADAATREPDAAPLAAPGKVQRGGMGGLILTLRSDAPVRLDASNLGEEVILRIPVQARSSTVSPVEVHVLDQVRERQLRERRTPLGAYVEMEVPTAWLLEGRYRVEVHAGGEPESDTFAFEVGA